jgi:hypothetical protein
MMEIIKCIVIAVFCSLLALSLHLAISVFRKGRRSGEPVIFELARQFKLTLAIWFFASVLYAYLFFRPPQLIADLASGISRREPLAGYVYGIILYLFLCFVYLTVYYLFDRSVSSTLLEIIENSPEGKLDARQIKEIYGIEDKYRRELKGMLEGGFIVQGPGYYGNSLKGKIYARFAMALKAILKLGLGG